MTVFIACQKTRPEHEKSRGPPEQLRSNIPVGKNPHLYGATCAHDYNDARLGFSGEVVAVRMRIVS